MAALQTRALLSWCLRDIVAVQCTCTVRRRMKLFRSVREAVISAATLSAGTTSTTCRSRSSLQRIDQ